jgi:hypothetical protein
MVRNSTDWAHRLAGRPPCSAHSRPFPGVDQLRAKSEAMSISSSSSSHDAAMPSM